MNDAIVQISIGEYFIKLTLMRLSGTASGRGQLGAFQCPPDSKPRTDKDHGESCLLKSCTLGYEVVIETAFLRKLLFFGVYFLHGYRDFERICDTLMDRMTQACFSENVGKRNFED
jgi:hypothetical protein